MAFNYQESGSQSDSTSQSGTLPWFNNYVQNLLGRGQTLSQQPWNVYQGNRVAGFTPDQQAAFSNLRGQIGDWNPLMNQATGATNQAQSTLRGVQSGPYAQGALNAFGRATQQAQFNPNAQQQFMNPYVSNVVNEIGRLGNENIQRNVGDIASSFTEAGQFGSRRGMDAAMDAAIRGQRDITGAQGNALYQAQQAAGQQYADWANRGIDAQQAMAQGQLGVGGFLAGLAGQQAGLGQQYAGLAGQQQQMGFGDVNAQLGIGQQQQAFNQAQLQANMQKFQEQQQAPWMPLTNYAQLLSGVPTPQQSTSTSTSTSTGWNTNFKRGGLAQAKKYANGGLVTNDEPDDIIDQLISGRLQSSSPTGSQLAGQAMDMRSSFLDYAKNIPELQNLPERSWMDQAGEAMLRAAAQGPANWGQLIGRSGASYFDIDNARREENQARAMARLGLMQKALPSVSLGGRGSMGGPSPEVVRTVYTGARNEAAQIAKDYGFNSAAERAQFIENYANKAVQNYLGRFATQPVLPRGLNGDDTPSGDVSISITPPAEINKPAVPAAMVAPTMAPPAPEEVVDPAFRNRPEEERQKKFATGTEEMAQKYYLEDIKPGAKSAEGMLNSINMLRQIPRTQDALAPYREIAGSVFDALGLDGKLAREASNLQQVRPLLAKVANDRLLQAKGVQTEGDAQRAFNEFVKITDTQKAANFMYAWTEELARRAQAKEQLYREGAQATGTWASGDTIWKDSEYMKTPPVAVIDGEPWAYSEWRTEFMNANPEASLSDAIKVWNKLSGRK